MKTIKELRQELLSVFNGLRSGEVDVKTASEMNNSAGKTINTIKVQLEYASLREEKPNIEFMKCS
jgi:hypothetical protein